MANVWPENNAVLLGSDLISTTVNYNAQVRAEHSGTVGSTGTSQDTAQTCQNRPATTTWDNPGYRDKLPRPTWSRRPGQLGNKLKIESISELFKE